MDTLLVLIIQYKYLAILPLSAIQGPIFALAVGFLVNLGYLDFFISFGILILGDAIIDTIYYYIGRYGEHSKIFERLAKRWKTTSNNSNLLRKLWFEHGRKTAFLSKLARGLSGPFLISAGMVKMPFGKFIGYAIPVAFFEYVILLATGYFLGNSYMLAAKYVKYGGILIAGILVIFVVVYFLFAKYARKRIIQLEKEGEKSNETN